MKRPDGSRSSHRLFVFFGQISRGVRRRLGELVFMVAIVALVAVTGFAAYINIVEKGWSSDAAAWAQAAGSIIAVAGAAWLAQTEARHVRRWRREQGEEAAWGARFVVSQAQFDAQIIAAELTRTNLSFDASDVRSWLQRSANASLALQTMLTRVDHIHPSVVVTMCNAKILVDHLSSDLTKLESVVAQGDEPDERLVADIVYTHINLATLIEQFDLRLSGIREALDRGRDMLPLDEWSRHCESPGTPGHPEALS